MLTLNTGFGFYSLGAFSKAYIDNTDISLTAASAGATIFLLANGIGGIPVARILSEQCSMRGSSGLSTWSMDWYLRASP